MLDFHDFCLTNFFSLVTASKGIGANLLKLGSKRRRGKEEMIQFRQEENVKAESMASKDKQIQKLVEALHESRALTHSNAAANNILQDMISKGHVKHNEDGSVDYLKKFDDEVMEKEAAGMKF